MKFSFFRSLLLLVCINLSGCGFCLFGWCFVDEMEVKERTYDLENNSYTIVGDVDGEYTSHTFTLGKEQTIEELSFGIWDADTFRKYTAIKKIHILKDAALQTYREKYLIPGVGCPASFMNQNLQSLLLLPVSSAVGEELEAYDIPFDGRGTEFKLTGHYLKPRESYFLQGDKKWTLDLEDYESVVSNVGSARHKLHYFLVTSIQR